MIFPYYIIENNIHENVKEFRTTMFPLGWFLATIYFKSLLLMTLV